MKKLVLGIIIGVLITSGVGAIAYNYNAKDIEYTPTDENWNVSNVQDAITQLYNTGSDKYILASASWKGAKSWNSAGFGIYPIINDKYITVSGSTVIIKKDCKIKINGYMANNNAPTAAPQYQLLKNEQQVLYFSNGKTKDAVNSSSVTIDAKKDDYFYLNMYGGGEPTYYITLFELV